MATHKSQFAFNPHRKNIPIDNIIAVIRLKQQIGNNLKPRFGWSQVNECIANKELKRE